MKSFFFCLVPSVISLKCYVCNSNEHKLCGSESNLNSFIQTCKQKVEPFCRKIEQTGRRKL